MISLIQTVVLWIHLVTAAFFVGGSLFVWLVLIPASHRVAADEAERTKLVGVVARQFGRIAAFDFLLLAATLVHDLYFSRRISRLTSDRWHLQGTASAHISAILSSPAFLRRRSIASVKAGLCM